MIQLTLRARSMADRFRPYLPEGIAGYIPFCAETNMFLPAARAVYSETEKTA